MIKFNKRTFTVLFCVFFVLVLANVLWLAYCSYRLESWPIEHSLIIMELRDNLKNDKTPISNEKFELDFAFDELIYCNYKNLEHSHKIVLCSKKSMFFFGQWYVITFGDEKTLILSKQNCIKYFLENFDISLNNELTKSLTVIRE